MNVVPLSAQQVGGYLAEIWPHLEQACEDGRYTPDDMLHEIENRNRQCWLVVDETGLRAVALTQITNERFKTCWVTHLSGNGLQEWQEAVAVIEEWARQMGCAKVQAIARPGFERVGKRHGYGKSHVLLTKEL